MNIFQREEAAITASDQVARRMELRDHPERACSPPRPIELPRKPALQETQPRPWIKQVDMPCQTCGGSGYDASSVAQFDNTPDCPECLGAGRMTYTRNYLGEAFQAAARRDHFDERSRDESEKITAVLQFARMHVTALSTLPPDFFAALRVLAEAV